MSNEELVALIQKGNDSLMLQLWDNVIGLVKKFAYRLYIVLEGRRGITVDDTSTLHFPQVPFPPQGASAKRFFSRSSSIRLVPG